MPFNAKGEWEPDNGSVEQRVAGITSASSPLMRDAATRGLAIANRRGLANSTIGIGSAQREVLGAATPIATADANIASADRDRATAALVALTNSTQGALSSTLSNPEIPAASRAAYQQSINDQMAATVAALERIYGTKFNWGLPATATPAVGMAPIGIGAGAV